MNLRCPLCGSDTFYIETEPELTFMQVSEDHQIRVTRPADAPAPDPPTARLNCLSCAWWGSVDDLVKKD